MQTGASKKLISSYRIRVGLQFILFAAIAFLLAAPAMAHFGSFRTTGLNGFRYYQWN
jgi:hypothetical protein